MPRRHRHLKKGGPATEDSSAVTHAATETGTDGSEPKKKKKLRPSIDVIYRLRHDSTLDVNRAEVVIGYKDKKYDEIQETAFEYFRLIQDGGDIPIHAVVYFRIGEERIWDRATRYDRVFGSGLTPPGDVLTRTSPQLTATEVTDATTSGTVMTSASADSSTHGSVDDISGDFKKTKKAKKKTELSPRKKRAVRQRHSKVKMTRSVMPPMGSPLPRMEVTDSGEVSYVYSFGLLPYRMTGLSTDIEEKLSKISITRDLHGEMPSDIASDCLSSSASASGHVSALTLRDSSKDALLSELKPANVEFLMIQHSKAKHWGFPKGRIEDGESPRVCAIRETQEEAGLCSDDIVYIDWCNPVAVYYEYSRAKNTLIKKWQTLYPTHCHSKCRFGVKRPREIANVGFFPLEKCVSLMGGDKAARKKQSMFDVFFDLRALYSRLMAADSSDFLELPRKRKEKISRALTKVLRHSAHKHGLEMDERGYVEASALMEVLSPLKLTLAHLKTVTKLCPKQRFGLIEESGKWLIRANQGHTFAATTTGETMAAAAKDSLASASSSSSIRLNPESFMTRLTVANLRTLLPNGGSEVCHGTYWKVFDDIIGSGGLNRMSRHHIHLAPFDSLATVKSDASKKERSGMRKSCELLIYVDVATAISEGCAFYVSVNGVVLTAGDSHGCLPLKYFVRIREFYKGVPRGVLWSNECGIPVESLSAASLRS